MPAVLNEDMEAWLSDNQDDYEFYLLHALFHNPLIRSELLKVPVESKDFRREEFGLVVRAFSHAARVKRFLGQQVDYPPTPDFMKTYVESAGVKEESHEEDVANAHALVRDLQDPRYKEQHYCVLPYLVAWYGSSRAKKAARQIQMLKVPNVREAVAEIERALMSASTASAAEQEDEMHAVIHGEDMARPRRQPTGIPGLDECLNGGWGAGECYLFFSGTAGGKCHGKGTRILAHDGRVVNVEDVIVGDLLMGPDSRPRRVFDLVRGRGELFRITPHRGADPVVVNRDHILTLYVTNIGDRVVRSSGGIEARSGQLINVTLGEYLESSQKFKHVTKWVQAGPVEFPESGRKLEIPPYLLGFWLGDGSNWHPVISKPGVAAMVREDVEKAGWQMSESEDTNRCDRVSVTGGLKTALRELDLIQNKHVPSHFLVASIDCRAALLAGLLDSDGCVHRSGWEFSNTRKCLVDAVAFLSRSLGYSATVSNPRKTKCQTGAECVSWRVHIQPYGEVVLPLRRTIPPARKSIKNPRANGFKVDSLGVGDFYGFNLEGPDRRYLLGDFSITHNSIAAGQCAHHVALTGGWPLIVSTELSAREYVARIVSAAATIPIDILQDCQNFNQVRDAVSQASTYSSRLPKADATLSLIRDRVHISKVGSDDGLDARSVIEREMQRYQTRFGRQPTWICLDWLGSMADVNAGGKGSSERAMLWELSANGCVKLAEETGIPIVVLAQAVNDAQNRRVLTINDIGISKGIGKNMVAVIGITNTINQTEIRAAVAGKQEMPRSLFHEDQFFCVCKARKGEGRNVPVRREFRYQKFALRPRN